MFYRYCMLAEQSKVFQDDLMATGEKGIIYASAYDGDWGIGISGRDNCLHDTSIWGSNYLGKILLKVRNLLNEKQKKEKVEELQYKSQGEENPMNEEREKEKFVNKETK